MDGVVELLRMLVSCPNSTTEYLNQMTMPMMGERSKLAMVRKTSSMELAARVILVPMMMEPVRTTGVGHHVPFLPYT